MTTFIAEVKKTAQTKKASLDNEYSVTLVTHDSAVLALGALPADVTVTVTVTVNED